MKRSIAMFGLSAAMVLVLIPGAAHANHSPRACSLLVCATAVATGATVVCDTTEIAYFVHVLTCKGVIGLGGHGDVPFGVAGLPGYVSWTGHGSCGRDCSDFETRTGYRAWGGFGDDGAGSDAVVAFPTVQKYDYNPFCCTTCIDYSVSGDVTSKAYAGLVVAVDQATSTDSDFASKHHCY